MAFSQAVVQLDCAHPVVFAPGGLPTHEPAPRLRVHRMNEIIEERGGSVRGWLLVLSLALMVWQPVNLGLAASGALDALAIRGWPLVIVIAVRVAVAGVGIAAGLAIIGRHPGAIAMAKVSLTLSAATDLFVYTTSYFPNNRLPGETPLYVAGSLAYYAAWMTYLVKRKRI
jgi:hypothetical protein